MKTHYTTNRIRKGAAWLALGACLLPAFALVSPPARAQGGFGGVGGVPQTVDPRAAANGNDPGTQLLKQVGFDQNLDAAVSLDLPFKDERGQMVKLRQYFGTRPVVMAMIYYHCTMLCSEVMNSTVTALKELPESAGKDYDVVVVSIDPRETAKLAMAEKRERVAQYGRKGTEAGFHFLTGDDSSIKPLAKTLGVHYAYDARTNEYAHPNGIVVPTPTGHIARYFYGLGYAPRDVRFGLMEASQGKIGSPVEKILLTCYHYDPKTGTYSASIMKILRLVGAGMVLLMAVGIGCSVLLEKRAAKRAIGKSGNSGKTPTQPVVTT